MGNNPSATTWQAAGLDKSKVLERLCGADSIYTSDTAWNDLLSIPFTLPKTRLALVHRLFLIILISKF